MPPKKKSSTPNLAMPVVLTDHAKEAVAVDYKFSDIVQSLRTQHLGILLLVISFFVAIPRLKIKDSTSIALEDLKAINTALKADKWNPSFPAQTGYDELTDIEYENYYSIKFVIDKPSFSGGPFTELITIVPAFIIDNEEYISRVTGWDSNADQSIYIPQPKTISDFIQVWEYSRQVTYFQIEKIGDHIYLKADIDSPVERVKILNKKIVLQKDIYDALLIKNIFEERDVLPQDADSLGIGSVSGYVSGSNSNTLYIQSYWIPVTSKKINSTPVDITSKICNMLGLQNRVGAFNLAFPDLYLASKDYTEIPLDSLEVILEQRKLSETSSIEIAGLRMPVSNIKQWSSLALMALSVFFYLHLHTLFTKLTNSREITFDVSWIGLFPDIVSKTITFFSLAILPVSFVAYLNIEPLFLIDEHEKWVSQYWWAIGNIILILLPCAFIGWKYISIWKLLDKKSNVSNQHTKV